jgi:hypothetical protein
MSRLTKFVSLSILLLFILACSTITRPFNQAQGLAETAQSIATAMPIQTLQSLATQVATQISVETLEALPSLVPSLEAAATQMPDLGNYLNPEGTPVSEWKGIPVMPQATAGQASADNISYSYKVDASLKEVQDFYKAELEKQGWSSFVNMPAENNGSIQMFQKDNSFMTITAIEMEGSVVVILTMS